MAASAQSSFTQRLQQSKSGEGKVTVTQDKAITDLGSAEAAAQVFTGTAATITVS